MKSLHRWKIAIAIFVRVYRIKKGGGTMKYSKPIVLNTVSVTGAVCGSGPSGRPCSKKA